MIVDVVMYVDGRTDGRGWGLIGKKEHFRKFKMLSPCVSTTTWGLGATWKSTSPHT